MREIIWNIVKVFESRPVWVKIGEMVIIGTLGRMGQFQYFFHVLECFKLEWLCNVLPRFVPDVPMMTTSPIVKANEMTAFRLSNILYSEAFRWMKLLVKTSNTQAQEIVMPCQCRRREPKYANVLWYAHRRLGIEAFLPYLKEKEELV